MPKMSKSGTPKWTELPTTLQRSSAKAQVAYAALKHSFEKVGDHWEAKAKRGPSDKRGGRRPEQHRPLRGRGRRQRQ
ncbi:hypothetical protein MMIN_07820 [Mycolicibacter minnesotensis]|nr:hypothetical protein MMIN_07820 [Mycolicibacter minnesotensis]